MYQRKGETLYNIIFPIWLLIWYPVIWIFVAPVNYVIDLLVTRISLKKLGVEDYKEKTRWKTMRWVWLLGFAADLIGTILMFVVNMIGSALDYETAFGRWWYENLTNAVSYNPFESIWAVLYVAACVAISGLLIYVFNDKIALRKLDLDEPIRKRVARNMAIFTAPYLFFLPTMWFY